MVPIFVPFTAAAGYPHKAEAGKTHTVVTMSGAVEIKTLAEYDTAIQSGKACVFFWAAWHEPSKPGGQMDEVIQSTSLL